MSTLENKRSDNAPSRRPKHELWKLIPDVARAIAAVAVAVAALLRVF